MKKHILGFVVFNFIFVFFALTFAYFGAKPVRETREIKPILVEREYSPMNCRKKSMPIDKEIKSEVISSQYIADENKVVSKIKISWNGIGVAPEKLDITAVIFNSRNEVGASSFGDTKVIVNPFIDTTEKTFTIVSRIPHTKAIGKQDNFYVYSEISSYNSEGDHTRTTKERSEATSVLKVYGENSVIKK